MGHTNETTNLHLPQFIGSDKPTWLGDINGAFQSIDSAYATIEASASGAVSTANNAANVAQSAATEAAGATSTAQSAATNAATAISTANNAAETANNAQSTAVLAKTEADEAKAAAVRGSVSVTADGTKTWGQLLAELAGIVDFTKLTNMASLNHASHMYKIRAVTPNNAYFVASISTTATLSVSTIFVDASAAYFADANVTLSPIAGASDNHTSEVPASGATITIYY